MGLQFLSMVYKSLSWYMNLFGLLLWYSNLSPLNYSCLPMCDWKVVGVRVLWKNRRLSITLGLSSQHVSAHLVSSCTNSSLSPLVF